MVTIHSLHQMGNFSSRYILLEHMNNKRFKRIIGSFIRSHRLLLKVAIPITRNHEMKFSKLCVQRPFVRTIS